MFPQWVGLVVAIVLNTASPILAQNASFNATFGQRRLEIHMNTVETVNLTLTNVNVPHGTPYKFQVRSDKQELAIADKVIEASEINENTKSWFGTFDVQAEFLGNAKVYVELQVGENSIPSNEKLDVVIIREVRVIDHVFTGSVALLVSLLYINFGAALDLSTLKGMAILFDWFDIMTGLTNRAIVIDGRGHLVGRLASVVAKYLLQGGKVAVVRCEELNLSGHFYRNKVKYLAYLRKRCNVNPARGPYHFRAPSRIFYKAVRGMIPHKTKRGQAALARLRVFDGIPPPYDKRRRVCVPIAMRILCLRSDRKYCQVGRLSSEVGWHYQNVVKNLERKRKAKLRVTLAHNKIMKKLTVQAREKISKVAEPFNKIIKSYGYE